MVLRLSKYAVLILEIGAELSKYWQYIGRLDPWGWPQTGEIMVQNPKKSLEL